MLFHTTYNGAMKFTGKTGIEKRVDIYREIKEMKNSPLSSVNSLKTSYGDMKITPSLGNTYE